MKIFLLEDDLELNQLIKSALLNKGFFVDAFTEGYSAIESALNSPYDIYILDINVPGFDGHQVLEVIRKEHKTLPVIIISAALDIDNMTKAYDLGCNDYLKKPFALEELFLHLKYLIKTTYDKDIENDVIDLHHGFTFDMSNQTLYKFNHEIILTKKEKLLLTLLIQNINNTVTIEEIHEYVWNSKDVESVSMRSLIHKLQKKLKSGMIINIRGVGYKLILQQGY